MKRRHFIQALSTTAVSLGLPVLASQASTDKSNKTSAMKRKIFITGGGTWRGFSKYFIGLTGKDNPKICFVPTATGDSTASITAFYASCEDMAVRPYVLKTFISSYNTKRSFEDTIMSMDAIVVGGGNTMNMLAVWKAHGIDISLRKAYESGILMSGGSAGSLCWFESGTTDSRPIDLSKVECLGWLKGSHCPHYDGEAVRRPLYQELIKKGELPPGYACDNFAGILFENEQFVKAVAANDKSHAYYVSMEGGKVSEKALPMEIVS